MDFICASANDLISRLQRATHFNEVTDSILAEERNQKLMLDITDGVVASVDRLVLREAVTNVLDNAIKYSPAGSTLAIHVGQVGDQALPAISDQGPGIPPEHRERIFHRFFRVDEARSRDRGGAGLALAIAKWAVDMHGGQITVDGRPGGGSEFRILLPVDRTARTTNVPCRDLVQFGQFESQQRRVRILLTRSHG